MLKALQRHLFRAPVIGVVAAVCLYLALGFLVLPALLQWQLPKQVAQRLDHRLHIGALRFDPLTLRLEADDLALADADGRPLLDLRRLQVDVEWRSLIDRAWTFSLLRLEAPELHFELQDEGRHNFSRLFDRLAGEPADEDDASTGELPRIVLMRGELVGGQITFSDRQLDDPLVTRIEALNATVDALGIDAGGRFHIDVRSAHGETLDGNGQLGLADQVAQGRLVLKGLQVSTLARALSRQILIDAPAGTLALDAQFDLRLAAGGPAGTVHDVTFSGDEISLGAAGSARPLFTAQSVVLDRGSVDLGRREVTLAGLALSDGSIAASLDDSGQPNWGRMTPARPAVNAPQTAAAAPADAASAAPAWRIVLPQARVSGIKLDFADAAAGRRVTVGRVDGELSAQLDAGAAGLTLDADTPGLALAGLRLEAPGQVLSAPALSLAAGHVRVVAAQALEVSLDAPELALPEGVQLEQAGGGLALGATSVQAGQAVFQRSGARLEGQVDAPRVNSDRVAWRGDGSGQVDALSLQAQRLTIDQNGEALTASLDAPRWRVGKAGWTSPDGGADLAGLSLQAGRVQVNGLGSRVQGAAEAVRIAAEGIGWRAAGSAGKLAQATLDSARVGAAGTGDGFEAEADQPRVSLSGVGFQQGGARVEPAGAAAGGTTVSLAQATIEAGRLAAAGQADVVKGDVGKAQVTLSGLRLRQDGAEVDLTQASASGTTVSLARDAGRTRIEGGGAELSTTGLAAAQGADRATLKDVRLQAGTWRVALPAEGSNSPGLEAGMEKASLTLSALDLRALGASSTLASLASARIDAGQLQLALSDGAPDVRGDRLGAELSTLVVQDPADAAELLRLSSATLAGGALALQQRSLRAERLALSDGQVRAWIDAQGWINWATLAGAAPAAQPAAPAPVTAAPWSLALAALQLDAMAFGFEDRRESPAFAIGVDAVKARVDGFDTASAQPMTLDLDARVASGGTLNARGSAAADGSRADVQLRIDALALAPLQPYLARFTTLRLAAGSASAEGRLRHGEAGSAGAALVYEGSASVDDLQLDEAAADRVFLSWGSVATGDLVLTLGPDRVDIGELRIDKPSGRLIIAEDQSINLTDVLKQDRADPATAKPDSADAETGEALAVSVARMRVADGTLDFADLSLRPQFRTGMHDLKGVINGLTTDPERAATVQLDAQVDRYGDAKIRGQLSLLRPEQRTDIEMAFRNLEMTSLSPYIAKFAGYRVAGGRLALDLRYQVRDRKLKGENKIVVSQLELGEKVDSPDALDLPLELAVAILKDADGVIDVGLPVSGDLGDPKFDVGAVVGKAIGGLLGGVVTAPFRALGALFGGGKKALDSIDFAPGRSTLAPPERGKLDTLAQALKARPALTLVVPPTYDAGLDRPALKSLAVRSEIVRRMGVTLADEDDPGALDVGNPRVQRAIEAALGERYAPAVVDALKRRAIDAAAPPAPAASAAPTPSAAGASAAVAASAVAPPVAAPPPASFYRGLLDRMIDETEVPVQRLAALAQARGQGVVDALTGTGGVAAPRIALGPTREAEPAVGPSEPTVRLQLALGTVE